MEIHSGTAFYAILLFASVIAAMCAYTGKRKQLGSLPRLALYGFAGGMLVVPGLLYLIELSLRQPGLPESRSIHRHWSRRLGLWVLYLLSAGYLLFVMNELLSLF